jgi:hypothetical protein
LDADWGSKAAPIHNSIGMGAQERLPALGWRPSALCHVFGNRRLANVHAEITLDEVERIAI